MAKGFGFDPEVASRTARHLADVRTRIQELRPLTPLPETGFNGLDEVLAAFAAAAVRSQTSLATSVENVSSWFDKLVKGEMDLDAILAGEARQGG